MKKKNVTLNGLTLNKKLISKLQERTIFGGLFNSNATTDPTSRPTLNTLELSHCYGVGIPQTCISINPCA